MNYKKIYDDFIADRQSKPEPDGYFETHHILPRHFGGDDSASNLIRLSAGDHYFAHLLLAKIHGKGMWNALHLLSQVHSTAKNRGVYGKRWVYECVKRGMSEAMSGENNPFYGRKHSEETRRRIREISLNMSEETKRKMSKAAKGKVISDATKQRMSDARKGDKNHFFGKTHTAETRRKISEANKGYVPTEEVLKKLSEATAGLNNPRCRKVRCVETGAVFDMVKDAAKFVGVCAATITRACSGYQKTSGGYHWEYYE